MRGAPISIRCDCGEARSVPYGESWGCEACGRRWNTTQIPAEEYWGRMRALRRSRLSVVAIAVAVIAVFVPLGLAVAERFFVLGGLLLAALFAIYLPIWRRRVRRQIHELPRWTLHPE